MQFRVLQNCKLKKKKGGFGVIFGLPTIGWRSIYWCSYTECVVTGEHRINSEKTYFQEKVCTGICGESETSLNTVVHENVEVYMKGSL